MAAIGGSALLTACGSEPAAPAAKAKAKDPTSEVQVFENVFACAKITGKSPSECDNMRQEALDRAKEEAPRYAAIQDCEAQYGQGNCVENGVGEEQGGRRHYSGFVVAWFSKSDRASTPLFSDKRGGYQTPNGVRLSKGNGPGKYIASNRAFERVKSVPKVKPASKLAKRGGFGGRNTGWDVADRNGKSGSKMAAAGAGAKGGSKGG